MKKDLRKLNLNDLNLIKALNNKEVNRKKSTKSHNVTVHFDDLESHLVQYIGQADAVFGCVAWLTNEKILEALSHRETSLILQKEDFLRPDFVSREKLRRLYDQIQCNVDSFGVSLVGTKFSHDVWTGLNHSNYKLSPISCLGAERKGKAQAMPLMHHKFVVFCKIANETPETPAWYFSGREHTLVPHPYAVWTGSFNFTWGVRTSCQAHN